MPCTDRTNLCLFSTGIIRGVSYQVILRAYMFEFFALLLNHHVSIENVLSRYPRTEKCSRQFTSTFNLRGTGVMFSESNRKIKVLLFAFYFTLSSPRKDIAVLNPVIMSLIGHAFFWTRSISSEYLGCVREYSLFKAVPPLKAKFSDRCLSEKISTSDRLKPALFLKFSYRKPQEYLIEKSWMLKIKIVVRYLM